MSDLNEGSQFNSLSNGARGRTATALYQDKHVLFYPGAPSSPISLENRQWPASSTSQWSSSNQHLGAESTNSRVALTSSANHMNSTHTPELSRMRRGDDWNDDTGGGPGTAADDLNRNLPAEQVPDSNRYNFKIGIYGWRKRCLYLLILGLMVMVIVNLALTLWVLKVMEFSSDGMGQLRVVTGGLQLSGQALVLDALRASTIRSRLGQSMTFESSKNFTVNTRDNEGFLENRLFLSNDRLECLTQGFLVTDARGSVLFSSNKKETVVGSETLRVTGEGGTSFSGSIQTPLVRSDARHDLRLESPTRGLEIRAPLAITIESRAGDLTATCLNDLKLHSVAGSIRLEGPNIMMPGLKTASPAPPQSAQSRGTRAHDIYQLCACANGKLFLAPPHGACAVDESGHMCR